MSLLTLKRKPEATNDIEVLESFQNEINKLFQDFFYPTEGALLDSNAGFPIDLIEKKDSYVLLADLPGIGDKDLNVEIASNLLTISGTRRYEEDGRGSREERFRRSVYLPDKADPDKIEAGLKDGVLRVVIGKRPEMQARKIELKRS
jgi:HSP20 family protein